MTMLVKVRVKTSPADLPCGSTPHPQIVIKFNWIEVIWMIMPLVFPGHRKCILTQEPSSPYLCFYFILLQFYDFGHWIVHDLYSVQTSE